MTLALLLHKKAKKYENLLNPVMLVFIGKLSLSTIRWVPILSSFHVDQISKQQG